MLAAALAAYGPALASRGNLNNHIGAPLSLARLDRSAAFAVFELGMNHPDEIRPLARLVRPHVALIRSEEHTSELQSLMRNSYAVFCLKKKKTLIEYQYPSANVPTQFLDQPYTKTQPHD